MQPLTTENSSCTPEGSGLKPGRIGWGIIEDWTSDAFSASLLYGLVDDPVVNGMYTFPFDENNITAKTLFTNDEFRQAHDYYG